MEELNMPMVRLAKIVEYWCKSNDSADDYVPVPKDIALAAIDVEEVLKAQREDRKIKSDDYRAILKKGIEKDCNEMLYVPSKYGYESGFHIHLKHNDTIFPYYDPLEHESTKEVISEEQISY
jgi:hypothetical protein